MWTVLKSVNGNFSVQTINTISFSKKNLHVMAFQLILLKSLDSLYSAYKKRFERSVCHFLKNNVLGASRFKRYVLVKFLNCNGKKAFINEKRAFLLSQKKIQDFLLQNSVNITKHNLPVFLSPVHV